MCYARSWEAAERRKARVRRFWGAVYMFTILVWLLIYIVLSKLIIQAH